MLRIKQIFLLLGFCVLSLSAYADGEKPLLVASIEPIAKIARELLGGTADIEVLLSPGTNPHQYALKVSDLEKLSAASLLLWSGPRMEPYLASSIAKTKISEISFASKTTLQPQTLAHQHHEDLHYWLSPEHALQMAKRLAEHLQLAPERLQAYQSRQQQLLDRWQPKLEARQLVVFHDGYDHLAQAFGFEILAAVSAGEGKGMSIHQRLKIRQALKEASCLIAEPYSEADRARHIAEQENIQLVWLDTLASADDHLAYHDWLEALLSTLNQCFEVSKQAAK